MELCTARSSSVYGRRPVLTRVFSAQNAQQRTHAPGTSRKIHLHGRMHPVAAAKVLLFLSTLFCFLFSAIVANLAVPCKSVFCQYNSLRQLCMQTEEASGAPKPNERFSRKVKPSTLPPLFAFLQMIRAADSKSIHLPFISCPIH